MKAFIEFQVKSRGDKFTPLLTWLIKKIDMWIYHYHGFLGRGVNYFELDMECDALDENYGLKPWTKISELSKYFGENAEIEDFEMNKQTIIDLIKEFERYFMSFLYSGESSLEASISKEFPDRLKLKK